MTKPFFRPYIWWKELCNTLNNLYEENEELKKEIKELEEFRYFVFKRIGEVVEK